MPCYRNWEPGGGLHCSSAVRRFDLPLRLHLRSSNKYPCIPEVVPLQTEILPILPAYKEVLSFQEKSSRRHTTKKAEQPHIRIYQARVRHESFNTFTTTEPRETSKRINKNKKGLSETERERWNRTLSKVLRLRSWYNQSSDQTPPTSHKKTPSRIPPTRPWPLSSENEKLQKENLNTSKSRNKTHRQTHRHTQKKTD